MVYMSGAGQPGPSVPLEGQILMAQKKNAVLPVRSTGVARYSLIAKKCFLIGDIEVFFYLPHVSSSLIRRRIHFRFRVPNAL